MNTMILLSVRGGMRYAVALAFIWVGATATGSYTNIPDATSPYTDVMTGTQRFSRLTGN